MLSKILQPRILRHATHVPRANLSFAIDAVSVASVASVAVPVGASLAYLIGYYKVASAHEKIVVTGPFVNKEMKIVKSALILPFQKYKFISVQAHSVETHVQAMTKEKIPFDMPMYFTICPDDSSDEKLSLFIKKFGDMTEEEIKKTIQSIVHGEARILTADMDVENLFNNRTEFKSSITDKIQDCLRPFGVNVENVNVGELNDGKESDYFKNMRERALQKSQRDANVATAEHAFNADSEKKTFEGENRMKVATIETETVTRENALQQNIIRSRTELKVFEANQGREAELARLEADAIAKKRDFDLQTEIQEKRRAQMIEQQKAEELSKTIVDKEKLLVETDAKTEQMKRLADAEAYKARMLAEASLYSSLKEAEGILAIQSAKAEGLKRNVEAAGGNIKSLEAYKMVDEGRHENIAQKYAEAVQGMNPTIFTNGSENGVSKVLADIGGSVSALATAYKKHTGIDFDLGTAKGLLADLSNPTKSEKREDNSEK